MQTFLAGPTTTSTSAGDARTGAVAHSRVMPFSSQTPTAPLFREGMVRNSRVSLPGGRRTGGGTLSMARCPPRVGSSCRGVRHVVQAGTGTAHPGEEREGGMGNDFSPCMSVPATGMAKFGGQLGGGGATLEKSKLDLSREVKSWDPKTDDAGGGGDNGNKIFNGGGGGDGDDGDDDDYFDDFGDDGEGGDGDGFFRAAVGQLYDEASRNAVLAEWFRTMADLPIMLRQAAQFGLLSSAQLVRFFSMDVRPNVTRFVTRNLPVPASRGIVGRLMADPAFIQKVAIEQVITLGSSLAWEYRMRRERFMAELDLVAINTAALCGSNLALVWLVSPSRSYGVPHKHDWQRLLHELPANVFDASGPQRQYTINARLAGLFAKTAELCGVGMLAGAAQSGLQHGAVALRRLSNPEWAPSVPVPDLGRSACGMAATLGIFGNLRYQLIAGADSWLFDHGKYLAPYLASSSLLRIVSNRLGEPTRLFLQGFPTAFPQAAESQVVRRGLPMGTAAPSSVGRRRPASKAGKRSGGKAKKGAKGFEMSLGLGPQPQAATAGAQ